MAKQVALKNRTDDQLTEIKAMMREKEMIGSTKKDIVAKAVSEYYERVINNA